SCSCGKNCGERAAARDFSHGAVSPVGIGGKLAENCGGGHRHCEERSDEAIQNSLVATASRPGLLRFARNDGTPHPEVRAQRASKDEAEAPEPHPSRRAFGAHLRMRS